MKRGRVVLIPGSEGAPWDVEIAGDEREIAGAVFTLLPAPDGSYRVFVMRLTSGTSGAGVQAEGFASNHNQTVLC